MDHITDLPESDGYDAILVIVCCLTKQGIFIPCNKTNTSEDLAKHYIHHVFSKHGLPGSIISDRGTMFVSEFWKELCKALDIKTDFSTAYHPQTDGQTERLNQNLEQYLRIYINYLQTDWNDYLPFAEFVYNNTYQDTIKMTPFYANKGYHPMLSIALGEIENHNVLEAAKSWKLLWKYLRTEVKIATETYQSYANERRTRMPNWQPGQKVYLNMKNICTKHPMKKLDHKNLGPFKIIAKIGSHRYKLNILKD